MGNISKTSSVASKHHNGVFLCTAVVSRVATSIHDDSSRSSGGAMGAGPSTSGRSSSSSGRGPDSGSGFSALESGMVPAVVLADAIGTAANNQMKHLQFKDRIAEEAKRDAKERQRQQKGPFGKIRGGESESTAAAAAGGGISPNMGFAASGLALNSSSSGAGDGAEEGFTVGPRTAAALQAYEREASKESAAYQRQRGKMRQMLKQKKGMPAKLRRATELAMAESTWDVETRVKVGAALLALLVENAHVAAVGRGGRGGGGRRGRTEPGFLYELHQVRRRGAYEAGGGSGGLFAQ